MEKIRSRFFSEENGTIFAEALIVIPVITVCAVGVVGFGNVMWQRLHLEPGVCDASHRFKLTARSLKQEILDFT